MKYEAIFCDETRDYRIPVEPAADSKVILRLRTARDDMTHTWLVTNDSKKELVKTHTEGCFDYYETVLEVKKEPVYYWFRMTDGIETCEYNRKGISHSKDLADLFRILPEHKMPEWARGAVMYQIYVDRFYDGDPSNNVRDGEYVYVEGKTAEAVSDWNDSPKALDVHRFFGGDLQGVLDKLDYLQDLGIEVLYLNPIFVSPSNHKYDCQDYDVIDPHYGVIIKDGDYTTRVTDPVNTEASNRFFAEFMAEVHRRGMRVIIDGVLNHCGSFHKWLNREKIYRPQEGYPAGAYEKADSPYHNYFKFEKDCWPDNPTYEGWWNYETLPKLNYEGSEELWQDVLRIGRKWVSAPYHVDGWRLDVAADLGHSPETNHRFWKEFRQAVREANPEAIVLAEHYEDPYPWVGADEWDTVMNYRAFMDPVTWYLTGMEKHSDEYRPELLANGEAFWTAMEKEMPRLSEGVQIAMNQLSNHDHSRFLTRTNRTVGRLAEKTGKEAEKEIRHSSMYQGVIMQMTWPGAPALYYGDEAGVCGWTDPDNRRTYPWGAEDTGLIAFHKAVIAIHKCHPALRIGSLHKLAGEGPIVAYGRTLGLERIVVVINAGDHPYDAKIPVWKTGAALQGQFGSLMKTSEVGFDQIEDTYQVVNGWLRLNMVAQSAIILKEMTAQTVQSGIQNIDLCE